MGLDRDWMTLSDDGPDSEKGRGDKGKKGRGRRVRFRGERSFRRERERMRVG